MQKAIVVLFLSLSVLFLLFGCGNEEINGGWKNSEDTSTNSLLHTIAFYDEGYIVTELSQIVLSGTHIILPGRTKIGYAFDGWWGIAQETLLTVLRN